MEASEQLRLAEMEIVRLRSIIHQIQVVSNLAEDSNIIERNIEIVLETYEEDVPHYDFNNFTNIDLIGNF